MQIMPSTCWEVLHCLPNCRPIEHLMAKSSFPTCYSSMDLSLESVRWLPFWLRPSLACMVKRLGSLTSATLAPSLKQSQLFAWGSWRLQKTCQYFWACPTCWGLYILWAGITSRVPYPWSVSIFTEVKKLKKTTFYFYRFIEGVGNAAGWSSNVTILMVIFPNHAAFIIASTETLLGLGMAVGLTSHHNPF